jgi:hypothetical protein
LISPNARFVVPAIGTVKVQRGDGLHKLPFVRLREVSLRH